MVVTHAVELADPRLFRHRVQLYRRGLSDGATDLGGSVWLSRKVEVPLYDNPAIASQARRL